MNRRPPGQPLLEVCSGGLFVYSTQRSIELSAHTNRRKGKNMVDLKKEISSTTYPGRGIVIGTSEDGKYAVTAYFIMGRSENSRNRVFVTEGNGIRTEAFDPSKMEDPSLIIYAPVRVLGNTTIVTNGDQTDTVYDLMKEGKTFEQALKTREFEPDAPNYTPRISGIMNLDCSTTSA